MNIKDLKGQYYFFKKSDYGRVYVFVDFGNVRPWAKELWPEENKERIVKEIDIAKLAEVINWILPVKKIFYYGRFVQNISKPNDHIENKKFRDSIYRLEKARKCGFIVVDKEIKMIPHYDNYGKFVNTIPKCNFDVEITMDMITKVENYDTAVLFSGDSDFSGLLEYLKNRSKKVIVVSTRKRMSKELQKVADVYVPAETLAKFL
jgi:uncharacterized LabA/DUF88 family protein